MKGSKENIKCCHKGALSHKYLHYNKHNLQINLYFSFSNNKGSTAAAEKVKKDLVFKIK